jgi:hypothetical protein
MFDRRRLASCSAAMGPTCDARLDVMAKSVIAKELSWASASGRGPISDISPIKIFRSWGNSSILADRNNRPMGVTRASSRVVYNGWSILLDRHSSKFEHDKSLAAESLSALPKNYRSRI